MHDAYSLLGPSAQAARRNDQLYDILYADDTLLLGVSACHVEALAGAVEVAGANYVLNLHCGKTQALSHKTLECLRCPDGTVIESSRELIYLGGLITSDGRSDSEVSRRLGLAVANFRSLCGVWNHGSVSICDKVKYFNSFVVSTLMYGLSTLSLTKAHGRRLNGFYCRCLRRILKIPAAFVSRVSNQTVLSRAGALPLTEQLSKRQFWPTWKSRAGF